MEIERINENTVKFYISYMDIEDRGFNREEIWYNRERSEQLFWQVMDEAGDQESFDMEGPLWIQVQAMEKGLEVTVTKAQLSKDGQNIELPLDSPGIEKQMDDKLEDLLESQFGKGESSSEEEQTPVRLIHHIVVFNEFEDAIQLSHHIDSTDGIDDSLYHYQGQYILILEFNDTILDDHVQDNMLSMMYEFGSKQKVAIPLVQEYGKVIFEDNALAQIKHYFNP
ncbi:adapter protein MecA 1/2 [Pelagirhabdus alkalitolerans]|uniref:Adapter protein MecA n=1 Tax=Pelagirhabdus alkalitolerans TaxID=1612202 RepID=A0A1G6KDH1_9BACI|nr:adaptor protein MecA [Pelagirhabdus alkalitolerans]SDC29003.1 adapter protein MecA 1/2 [Pelagirhabdus alkalitolerans]